MKPIETDNRKENGNYVFRIKNGNESCQLENLRILFANQNIVWCHFWFLYNGKIPVRIRIKTMRNGMPSAWPITIVEQSLMGFIRIMITMGKCFFANFRSLNESAVVAYNGLKFFLKAH